ncbi:hypothetical protein KKB44_03035 [Candidatus Micrarchaeota archaeon]|nr:hypothetical protein [Candidatus Micrarchaeota archaeon]
MFEVLNLVFTEGEVKRLKHNVPETVTVDVSISKITQKEPSIAILDFTYAVDYKPQVGQVKIVGQAYCKDTPQNIKKAQAEFKKKKILPMEYGARVINMINANAGMNSIFLIRPFNLLPPFMPPLISTEEPKKKK